MNVKFEACFLHDVKKIREKFVKKQIEGVIEEIEKIGDLTSITNVKKLKGEKIFYRIRSGDYRIGFRFSDDTVILDRVLNRKEIYRRYPPK